MHRWIHCGAEDFLAWARTSLSACGILSALSDHWGGDDGLLGQGAEGAGPAASLRR